MDPGAVTDGSKGQHPQFIAAESLQAALLALLPGAAGPLLPVPAQPLQPQSVQAQLAQGGPTKQPSRRKASRSTVEEPASAGPPRPPPIKHEVYEDLEEKFNQLQSGARGALLMWPTGHKLIVVLCSSCPLSIEVQTCFLVTQKGSPSATGATRRATRLNPSARTPHAGSS